jgi:Family of unknown function (DUF5690)
MLPDGRVAYAAERMSRSNPTAAWRWNVGATLLAFATYFCMYAFRKPFAAGMYVGDEWLGLAPKTWFVTAQIIGYAASKYLGIRWISEARRQQRLTWLLGLIAIAELALLGFAVLPFRLKIVAICLNGLPLGMVWGLVVRYLEGRRASDFLLAGLSCSFIVASGIVKDVGRWTLTRGVDEYWMPALTGLLFVVPFALAAFWLDRFPEPGIADIELKSARLPMDRTLRIRFFRDSWPGLLPLLVVYLGLTAFRDYRDNYGVEIFRELGYQADPTIFSRTELIVGGAVLITMGCFSLVRGRRSGLLLTFLVMGAGLGCVGLATWARSRGFCSGETWMTLIGLGTYLAYVPFSSFLFDRLMAATRFAGTAVFAINLADAVGYTGSVALQLYKDLGSTTSSRVQFFDAVSYCLAVGGCSLLAAAAVYFLRPSLNAANAQR